MTQQERNNRSGTTGADKQGHAGRSRTSLCFPTPAESCPRFRLRRRPGMTPATARRDSGYRIGHRWHSPETN